MPRKRILERIHELRRTRYIDIEMGPASVQYHPTYRRARFSTAFLRGCGHLQVDGDCPVLVVLGAILALGDTLSRLVPSLVYDLEPTWELSWLRADLLLGSGGGCAVTNRLERLFWVSLVA